MFTVRLIVLTGILLGHMTSGSSLYDDLMYAIEMTWSSKEKEGNRGGQETTCQTEVCKRSAKAILNSLDPKINPCEDFYSFACGGWIKNHPVPPTENHWNQFDIMERKVNSQIHQLLAERYDWREPEIVKVAKKIYKSCMNTENDSIADRIEERGVMPLVNFLEQFNNWPITTNTWNEETMDWQKLVGDITRKLALGVILFVYVDVDRKNTSRNIIIVDEPNLTVPKYVFARSEQTFMEAYVTYIMQAAELLAKARGQTTHMLSLRTQAFNIYKFEKDLSDIIRKEEEKRNADESYHWTTIGQLQNWTDGRIHFTNSSIINWEKLFENILGDDLTAETPVAVTSWEYLGKLMNLIDTTPPRVLANYILWRVVQKMSSDVNQEMRYLNFIFKRRLSSITEDYPRWRHCVSTANQLSYVVGYMYVQRHFTEEAKSKAIEMVRDIRSAFKQELLNNPWMDDESKKAAIEKAEVMNELIGYPDWFSNITYLEDYYKGIDIGDDHFENKIKLRELLARKILDNLKKETNRDEWIASPAIANAFYNPYLNSIIFPAGVLQDPFFSKDQPLALNYGGIGSVVGHEITHAFDDMGRQSDKYGNIKHWWTKDTENSYKSNALCFSKQYGNYRMPELDLIMKTTAMVDGVRTLDENIADNGGLSAALRAYLSHRSRTHQRELRLPGLEKYSHEQLFYIGFARVWCESHTPASLLSEVLGDPHSPHKIRVTGSVSNLKHFAATWRCGSGSKMNPKQKCRLW